MDKFIIKPLADFCQRSAYKINHPTASHRPPRTGPAHQHQHQQHHHHHCQLG